MKKAAVIVLLLIVYLVGLVALTPARFVMQFVDTPPNIELGSVSGTLWNGHLGSLRIDDVMLHDIQWRLNTLSLLTGRAQINFEVTDHPQNIFTGSGRARLGLNSAELFDVRAHARLIDLAQFSPVPNPFELQGEVVVQLAHYRMGQPVCAELDGAMQLTGAALRMGRNWIELGDFSAQVACEEGRVVAVVDETNTLGLTASVQLWGQGGEVEFQLDPPAEAPRTVRNLMSLLPDEARQPQRLRFNF